MIVLDPRTGYLPEGVHRMPLAECARLFAWNARRRFLFNGLDRAITNLARAGCRVLLIDGSFVTAEELPNDWDAAFDPTGVIANHLDPILIKHDDGRRSMRAKYLGNMFPWTHTAASGDPLYKQLFQHDRDGNPKGIVEIQLQVIQ